MFLHVTKVRHYEKLKKPEMVTQHVIFAEYWVN